MSEYDDDKQWKYVLDRERKDPSVSPNLKYQLERQVKKNKKQELSKLHREMARKELNARQRKLKDEMAKKSIQNVDTKPDDKQFIEAAKRKEESDRAQGQTEKPAQAA